MAHPALVPHAPLRPGHEHTARHGPSEWLSEEVARRNLFLKSANGSKDDCERGWLLKV